VAGIALATIILIGSFSLAVSGSAHYFQLMARLCDLNVCVADFWTVAVQRMGRVHAFDLTRMVAGELGRAMDRGDDFGVLTLGVA